MSLTFEELFHIIFWGKPPPPGDFQYVFHSSSNSYSNAKINWLLIYEVIGEINLTFDFSLIAQSEDKEYPAVLNSPRVNIIAIFNRFITFITLSI